MAYDFSLKAAWGAGDAPDLDFDPRDDFAWGGRSDGIESERYMRPRLYDSIGRKCAYERAEDFVSDIELCDGFRMFAFVSGNFIFGDVVEAMVARRLFGIRRITIQTLSMNQENIDSLYNVMSMSPKMESMRIVLSDYFYSHERRVLVPYLYETLDIDGGPMFDCAFASVHTKIVTIETTRGNKLVMDGSANLRSSYNVEQVRLEVDAGLYDFVEGMADRVFAAYSTINQDAPRHRSVRYQGMWDAVTGKEANNGERLE